MNAQVDCIMLFCDRYTFATNGGCYFISFQSDNTANFIPHGNPSPSIPPEKLLAIEGHFLNMTLQLF